MIGIKKTLKLFHRMGVVQIFEGFLMSKSDKTAINADGNGQGGAAAPSRHHY